MAVILGFLFLLMSGCANLQGSVSTISHSEPPEPVLFHVLSDSMSVTDRNIATLIEAKLIERGCQKADSLQTATVRVVYKFSIDQVASVYSTQDFVVGGHHTHTTFPRHFQIAVFDVKRTTPEHIALVWQGELFSEGESRNISFLAPHFIDVLFEHYGKTVSDRGFTRPLSTL